MTEKKLKITLLQDSIFWADKQENLQKTELQLKKLSGKTELVVLPEMFTTGFCTNRLDLAETMQGETVRQLKKWAIDYDLAIVGSFIVEENERYYNRAFFVFPNGEVETADKRHLFAFGGEDKLFSAGDKRLIVNYKGFNVFVLVCYTHHSQRQHRTRRPSACRPCAEWRRRQGYCACGCIEGD